MRTRQQEIEKNSNFPQRLREAREKLGMRQEDLGKHWGKTGNYIYMLEAGKKPFPKKLELRVLKLEKEVMEKFGGETPAPRLDDPFQDEGQKFVERGPDPALLKGEVRIAELSYSPRRKVPVVGFAAGADVLSERSFNYSDLANQIEENIETDSRDPNALGLIVEGDSMFPEYQAGDRIIVAPNAEPRNGDVVVVRLAEEGSAMIKRFHRSGPEGKVIRLESTNQDYPPREYPLEAFRFIYPVVEMQRKRRR